MRPSGRWGWRQLPAALCAAIAGLVLAGCGAGNAGSGVPGGGGSGVVDSKAVLQIGMPVAQSLDPRQAPEPAELMISTWPVYDRLIQITPASQYVPMLATKWQFSPDGKALTLTLRQGVTFSDGTPFNAQAVKANLDFYTAATNTPVQIALADLASVQVLSDYVVKLNLKAPSTTILSALSSEQGGDMISPKALHSKDLSSHPVGTGAYVITSFTPGQQVVYTRRADKGGIWDPAAGKPAKVVVTTYSSPQALQNSVTSGQANIITWPGDKTQFRSQLSSGQLAGHIMNGVLNSVGINFNRAIKPFNNLAVRQAVNYAIDRSAIVNAFLPGSSTRVQPWPKGLPGFDQSRENAYPYNPGKARKLLADAGFPNGVDGGTFLVGQAAPLPQAAQAVQANLAAVGIRINIQVVNIYSIISQWAQGKEPAEIMYMSIPSIDPYLWLQRLFVNRVWVPTGSDSQMVNLIAGTGDPTLSTQALAAKVGKAVDYATSNALYAPLWQGVGGYMAASNVKGLDNLASVIGGIADFRDVYMVK